MSAGVKAELVVDQVYSPPDWNENGRLTLLRMLGQAGNAVFANLLLHNTILGVECCPIGV